MDQTPTRKPLHQRAFIAIGWLAGGVMAVGTLLDALSNSIELVTPRVTYAATAAIAISWIAISVYVRNRGLSWISAGGRPVRIVDNQIVVLGNGRARVCKWKVDQVQCAQERVDAGDNTVFVEYTYVQELRGLRAFGSSGVVNESGDTIRLRIGQLLSLSPRDKADVAYRALHSYDGVLEYRSPFYYAKALGETSISVESASGTGSFIILVIPDGDY